MASILKLCYAENPVQQLRLLISLQTERKWHEELLLYEEEAYRNKENFDVFVEYKAKQKLLVDDFKKVCLLCRNVDNKIEK